MIGLIEYKQNDSNNGLSSLATLITNSCKTLINFLSMCVFIHSSSHCQLSKMVLCANWEFSISHILFSCIYLMLKWLYYYHINIKNKSNGRGCYKYLLRSVRFERRQQVRCQWSCQIPLRGGQECLHQSRIKGTQARQSRLPYPWIRYFIYLRLFS